MNPSSLATCRRCMGCQTRSWQPGSAAASVPSPEPGWGGVSGFLENIAEIWSTLTVRTLVWLVDTLPHPPPSLVFPSPSGARCLLSAVSQGSSSGVIDSSSQARPDKASVAHNHFQLSDSHTRRYIDSKMNCSVESQEELE